MIYKWEETEKTQTQNTGNIAVLRQETSESNEHKERDPNLVFFYFNLIIWVSIKHFKLHILKLSTLVFRLVSAV